MKRYTWLFLSLLCLGGSSSDSFAIALTWDEIEASIAKSGIGVALSLWAACLTKESLYRSQNIVSNPINLGVTLAYGYAALDAAFYTYKHLKHVVTEIKEDDTHEDNVSSPSLFKSLLSAYIASAALIRNSNNLQYGVGESDLIASPIQPMLWYTIYQLYPQVKNLLS